MIEALYFEQFAKAVNRTRNVDALNADRFTHPGSRRRRQESSPVENVYSSLEFKLFRFPQAVLRSFHVPALLFVAERLTPAVLSLTL